MNRILRPLLFLLLACLIGGAPVTPLHAQHAAPDTDQRTAPSPPRPWATLDAAQRDVLAPLKTEWDSMSPRKQARMLHRAERWVTLPPEKREEVRQHIAHWQQMTPAERKQARANMRKFHQLPEQQREQLHDTFERFQKLPPAQREDLIRRWRALPPEQRRHWHDRPDHQRPSPTANPPPPPSGT